MCTNFKHPKATDGTVCVGRTMEFPDVIPWQLGVVAADHDDGRRRRPDISARGIGPDFSIGFDRVEGDVRSAYGSVFGQAQPTNTPRVLLTLNPRIFSLARFDVCVHAPSA